MERVVLVLILFYSIGSYSQDVNDFTMIKEHIKTHGTPLSRHKRGLILFRLKTEKREIQYSTFINEERIAITHLLNESKLPEYVIYKEGNSLKISDYYSRFDTEEDLLNRKNDWELLVYEIESSKVPKHLLKQLEQGNLYWAEKRLGSAGWAYRKFVDLMKTEGLEDQVPKMVKTRLVYCRYRKN